MTFTFQSCQRVVAALLVAGKEAITVQEVGPGHVDGLKGVNAVLPQGLAGGAARFDHLVFLAGRGQDRAADQADLRRALPIEEPMDDAQEEVLWARLCICAAPVAQDVGEHGTGGASSQHG